ncbi:MAG: DUF3943 domain-containing protein [Prevotella sp.]
MFDNVDSLKGVQIGLISGRVHRDTRGVNYGFLEATTRGDLRGWQLSGMGNIVHGTTRGLQTATFTNYATKLKGVQLAGIMNISGQPMRGVQIAGGANIAMGMDSGLQLSLLANVTSGHTNGVQVSGYNYADTLNGWQVGVINSVASHTKGWQVGVVNYSVDTIAHKIGLINVNPKTRIDIMAFLGTSSVFNSALRFRNRSTYNIIGMGTHYMGLDHKFSGALYYRIGQYFNVAPRWSVSGDVGYYHIETFEENSRNKPERLYSLQVHANVDYRINRTLGAFVSVGYGDTRYYGHHRKYENEWIAEAGLTIHWPHRHSSYDIFAPNPRRESVADSLIARWNDGRKNYWLAAAEATGINVLVHCFDRFVMNEDFAQVHFKDIARNWRDAFVWDNDQFSTNLFAHPYHGNLYFNSARSNGLTFWESAPYALGGSLMWEFCGEVEPPAINDLMATTCGGMAIGEVTHRISELILNNADRGFSRFLREAAATIINPMGGFNRIIKGDAWRVDEKHPYYYDHDNLPIDFSLSVGVRYLSDDGGLFRGEFNPYVNVFLEYGDVMDADHTQPYDFFYAEATIGLSANQPLINRLHLLGRLWGKSIETRNKLEIEWGIYQHFNYYDSEPVKNGTSLTPYRISEAASFGPGVILRFPQVGALRKLEQRIFLSGILLGGTKSDYYNVIDRDYNMGSGFSVKTKTHLEFRNFGRFIVKANYFRIYTWKGYEGKDLETVNPLYLNAQGDKGNAELAEITPIWEFDFKGPLSASASTSYFFRHTRYSYHPNVIAKTFEVKVGLTYHF